MLQVVGFGFGKKPSLQRQNLKASCKNTITQEIQITILTMIFPHLYFKDTWRLQGFRQCGGIVEISVKHIPVKK